MLVSMRVTAPGTDARTGGYVGPTAAATAPTPQGHWARLPAAAVADEVPPEPEPAHVDFLRRMAEIDNSYDQGLATDSRATVVDFAAARRRLRP